MDIHIRRMGYSGAGWHAGRRLVDLGPVLIAGGVALDLTALPLPPEARAILRDIADDVRKPPPGTSADPIALRRWLDKIGKRLDGLAVVGAGGGLAPTAVARKAASPRAAMREQDRPAGIVVETRRRIRST